MNMDMNNMNTDMSSEKKNENSNEKTNEHNTKNNVVIGAVANRHLANTAYMCKHCILV